MRGNHAKATTPNDGRLKANRVRERALQLGFWIPLILSFSGDGTPVRQHVPVLATACNYGGERQWFGCPNCGWRVAILYLRAARFACRSCQRVTYASQSEDALGRLWRKQSKAEAKLEENLRRPKGMHRRTRERLLDVIYACEEARDNELAEFVERMGWRY